MSDIDDTHETATTAAAAVCPEGAEAEDCQALPAMEPLDLVEVSEIEATPWSIRRRLDALFWRWPTALWRQWPLLLVWSAIIVGLVLVYRMYWRRGSFVIGAAFALAALFRLVLSPERAGLLVVRNRFLDVAITGLAGAAVMGLALIIQPR